MEARLRFDKLVEYGSELLSDSVLLPELLSELEL